MLSSEGKPTDSSVNGKPMILGTNTQSDQMLDREQVFRLIETTLSFEACLYHQILPFKIEDNNLLLGMVNPQDNVALDYVNRLLPYLKCKMETQAITGDIHRTILSAYLNYKNNSALGATTVQKSWEEIAPEKDPVTFANQATSSIDSQTEPANQTTIHTNNSNDTTTLQFGYQPSSASDRLTELINRRNHNNLFAEEQQPHTHETANPDALHILQLSTPKLMSPLEDLATLPPKKLLEQLLGRVLADGIGRLYLERRPYHGRILWSENGVLQSVLEKVPLSVFQGVLNELKRFASLPITTVVEPKQVERECLYQQNRLLLRLRVMPGMYGEEATLQVLRGAALKFYQQQQVTRLSHDAMGISQQLIYKLRELKERLALNYKLNSGQAQAFETLNQLLDNLDQQMKIITDIQEGPPQRNKP
ncbi:MAG: pilus assembly protein PilB [Scytonema sp. PMC 1069.18]|nr:pilus assembly protein PilB [Scytonema sp. PMC 1069.18]MEC4881481.1 pilus assembly protein PilB [Scytonema sp. PMC 1070.18]